MQRDIIMLERLWNCPRAYYVSRGKSTSGLAEPDNRGGKQIDL